MIKVIELEDYTRRENLKFHNIPESEEEGVNHSPKQVILSILQKELQMVLCTNSIPRSASNWQAKRKQTQTDPCSLRLPRRQRSGFCQEEGN